MFSTYRVGGKAPHDDRRWQAAFCSKSAAVVVFAALAGLDLCLPNISFVVLFSVPLLLLANRVARIENVWWYVTMFIAAIYALYFLKYLYVHSDDPAGIWSFRLFNRTFAALMLALLGLASQAWLYWQHERSLLAYLDRADEDEVNATAGLIGCIGLGLLITALDFVSPANFNLPILFVVPLYLASWLCDPRSLWITAILLVGLTWAGYFVTPAPTQLGLEPFVIANRVLVTTTLLAMAAVLHWAIRPNLPESSTGR